MLIGHIKSKQYVISPLILHILSHATTPETSLVPYSPFLLTPDSSGAPLSFGFCAELPVAKLKR